MHLQMKFIFLSLHTHTLHSGGCNVICRLSGADGGGNGPDDTLGESRH